jgi:hypothetical protein
MKWLLLTFTFFLINIIALAQTEVLPYSLTVGHGEFVSFDGTNTQVNVWVNNGSKERVEISDKSVLDLIDTGQGIKLSDRVLKERQAYREENARLREQGTFRMNPAMDASKPPINVSLEGMAEDTTGFVFKVFCVAPPPKGCKSLQLKGTVVYSIPSEVIEEMEVEVNNIAAIGYDSEGMVLPAGDTLRFEQRRSYDEGKQRFSALLSGYKVEAIGINGTVNDYNNLELPTGEVESKHTVTIKARKLVSRKLPIEEMITLGVGYE